MCACMHTVVYRGARANTSTCQCVMLAEPHIEMMPKFPDGQVASHQLPNFRHYLQQAKPKVEELEWLWLPHYFIFNS